jgi:mono/diheme cytochrome c family protein
MRTPKTALRVTRFALLTMAGVLVLGASRAAAQENAATTASVQKWNYDELTNAPEKARARQNPLEGDPDAVRAGGKLFERHCAECHGMKAEGGKRAPSLLRGEVQQAPPGVLFWVLTNGVVWHGMPVWSKLPEPQRWQIVTFLKSLNISATPGGPGGG